MEGTKMNINRNIKRPQYTNIKLNTGDTCFIYMKYTGAEVNVCVKY